MSNKIETVLAVVVLYNRRWAKVPASLLLLEKLRKLQNSSNGDYVLLLDKLVIYDNSPTAISDDVAILEGVEYVNNTLNGGTRAAYEYAFNKAYKENMQWVLFLDQDTFLPDNFFSKAADSIRFGLNEGVGVLLPKVTDNGLVISPSYISLFGSIKKISEIDMVESSIFKRNISGIASGSMIKVAALNSLPAIPPILWLDYVDHWIFLSLKKLGVRFSIIDIVLEHHLSISNIGCIDKKRIFSILDGENEFICHLGIGAKIVYPFRIIFRYIKLKKINPEIAKFIYEWFWARLKKNC